MNKLIKNIQNSDLNKLYNVICDLSYEDLCCLICLCDLVYNLKNGDK